MEVSGSCTQCTHSRHQGENQAVDTAFISKPHVGRDPQAHSAHAKHNLEQAPLRSLARRGKEETGAPKRKHSFIQTPFQTLTSSGYSHCWPTDPDRKPTANGKSASRPRIDRT